MEKAIKKYFPVFALPTLVAFTIGFIVPLIMGIYLSEKLNSGFGPNARVNSI